jgi:parvulin-like peptidyl-prolyl isomerase
MVAGATVLALTGCSGSGDSSAVVTVDGEDVTKEQFNQYISTKRTVRVVVQGQVVEVPVAETLGFQAMQELATQKVVMHMAADEGLMPTADEVEAEIEFKKAITPSFLNDLKAAGYTMGQIRREVTYSLCEERLLTRGIKVDMAEVDKMIKENPAQFMEPATLDVYQILVLSEQRKAMVDQELRTSQSFKAVAAKLNQDPSGERKQLPVAQLRDPFKTIFADARPGFVTDWIPSGTGFVKMYLEGRTEAKPIEMTPEKKEYLRRQIAMSYGRQANDLPKKVADRLRSSDVMVSENEAVLKEMWKRFEDRLEKVSDDSLTKPDVEVKPGG